MKPLNDILWNNEDLMSDMQDGEGNVIVTPNDMDDACVRSYSSAHRNPYNSSI